MDRLIERCAGLDVHKATVTACVRIEEGCATVLSIYNATVFCSLHATCEVRCQSHSHCLK